VKMGKHPPLKVVVFHDDEGSVFPVSVCVIRRDVVGDGPLLQVIKVGLLGIADLGVKGVGFKIEGGYVDLELGG
jgi:hypothetical protein